MTLKKNTNIGINYHSEINRLMDIAITKDLFKLANCLNC